MIKKPNFITIIFTLIILTTIGCTKEEVINTKIYTSENTEVPNEVWAKFAENQQIDINTAVGESNECEFIFEEFDIEFWSYPNYDVNGKMVDVSYPIIGNSNNGELNRTNIVVNQGVKNTDLNKSNAALETGNANINYWTTNDGVLKSSQLMINIKTLQSESFDLAENTTKYYISNGTGKFDNISGFAYAKIVIDKEPIFGCYPNNKDYPDNFEDGTCSPFMNCDDCKDGEGNGKLYLIGYTCK